MSENFFESNTSGNRIAPDSNERPTASVTTDYTVNNNEGVSAKSRLAALLFGIFLGNIGIHNFYLGRIKRGIVQCILSVLGIVVYVVGIMSVLTPLITSGEVQNINQEEYMEAILPNIMGAAFIFFICTAVVGIWSFIEWIMIAAGVAKDSSGKVVKNW